VLDEFGQATAERDRLAEQLRARTGVVQDSVLRAPVAGVVQDLAVAGAGQSVAAHETLMKLVPLGDGLAVETRVANEDIGRVAVGMPATIKVRAFDYLRFGSVEGSVERVAADASPDPKTGTLAYTVTVAADTARLGSGPGQLDVVPGMTVDVEVKVGRRTILSYLTDRIFRLKEAFRET
jgi:HlyD family type I secretion membrane fusion protein